MVALISFLGILFLSLTIVRIATVMLRLTGLSKDIAQFQARSAFTTTGFTAQESENIMNHPMRRKIIQNLMVMGNVGFVSFVSSLVLTMLSGNETVHLLLRLVILVGGSLLLFIMSRLPFFDSLISWVIRNALKKDIRLYRKDYENLLSLARDFEVIKVRLKSDSWMTDIPLKNLSLSDEGILVIGIHRQDGYFVGSPRGESVAYPGDEVVLYGREEPLKELAERRSGNAGDLQHMENVKRQRMLEGRRTSSDGSSEKDGADSGLLGSALRRFNRRK